MYFHPDSGNILPKANSSQLFAFIANIKKEDLNTDHAIHIIDDETLNRFVKFYSNKSIENLEIYQKEEIRCILESMGDYNTNKLKKFLRNEQSRKEVEIYKLLSENLFDKQLMLLNEMLN